MTPLLPIPDGWTWALLGEIADVVGGVTKDSKKQSDPTIPLVPYLRVANVQRGRIDLSSVTEIRVPESTANRLQLQSGDVLLNEGGDRDKLGRGWVWEGQIPRCIHQNHVFRARIRNEALRPKLLAWFANECAREWFERYGKQTTNLASISLSMIKQLPVPIPPLDEQERLQDLLEDHLSRLDAAATYFDQAGRRARRLRAAIVSAELAKVNGKRHLIGGLSIGVRNGIFVSRAKAEPNGTPILRIGAVRPLALDLTDLRYSEREAEDLLRSDALLQPGDLLFTRYNGNSQYVGACAVVPGGIPALTYPDKLIRVRPDPDLADPGFVALACSFGDGRKQIQSKIKTTSGQMGISGTDLKNVEIVLPPLSEQLRIAAQVRESLDSVRMQESALETAQHRVNRLRRALFMTAFSGELLRGQVDTNLT
ncbi:restriction endonuclease subunit S [Amycolatopsis palatopharyngis]|uniref:restriction endonuclease subunit S n=1 Tax=Amycolatopsis palatopharyngis TaxID=187982 RepID=UPI000E236196|nr:restriction endonuclease subunit S [Amycolatopsis palatopharyngis]